jgi:hypothetical protein
MRPDQRHNQLIAKLFHIREPVRQFSHHVPMRHWAISAAPRGAGLEFGVGGGDSLRLFAKYRFMFGFDSFKGLPEDWRPGYPKGTFACEPPEIFNTWLFVGEFAATVSEFVASRLPIGFVHVDCDLYASAATALTIAPLLVDGAIILFDEYYNYDGWEDHEHQALMDSGIDFDYIAICSHEQVAIRVRK